MKAYPYRHIQRVGKEISNNRIAIYSKYPILSARELQYESSYNGSAIYELKEQDTIHKQPSESNKLIYMKKC